MIRYTAVDSRSILRGKTKLISFSLHPSLHFCLLGGAPSTDSAPPWNFALGPRRGATLRSHHYTLNTNPGGTTSQFNLFPHPTIARETTTSHRNPEWGGRQAAVFLPLVWPLAVEQRKTLFAPRLCSQRHPRAFRSEKSKSGEKKQADSRPLISGQPRPDQLEAGHDPTEHPRNIRTEALKIV